MVNIVKFKIDKKIVVKTNWVKTSIPGKSSTKPKRVAFICSTVIKCGLLLKRIEM